MAFRRRLYFVLVRTGAQAPAQDEKQVDVRRIEGNELKIRPAGSV
jgi:hypothetical protein